MSATGSGRAPLSTDQIDAELARLHADADAMSLSLLALMDDESGYRRMSLEMKNGRGTLTGETLESWNAIEADVSVLLEYRDKFTEVLQHADAVRGRRSRLGAQEQTELTELLHGDVVELESQATPLQGRKLTDPDRRTRRMSVADLEAEMNACYDRARDAVVVVAEIWDRLLTQVDDLEIALRSAESQCRSLGEGATGAPAVLAVRRARSALSQIDGAVRTDPLSQRGAEASVSTVLAGIADEVRQARPGLDELKRLRDGLATRLAELRGRLGRVENVEKEVRARYTHVLTRITAPTVPEPPDAAPVLRALLDRIGNAPDAAALGGLAAQVATFERRAASALTMAEDALRRMEEPLRRRNELRGRLDAYKAAAGSRGLAENPTIMTLYQRAHRILWSAPCDLGVAEAAVKRYQRAVRGEPDESPEENER